MRRPLPFCGPLAVLLVVAGCPPPPVPGPPCTTSADCQDGVACNGTEICWARQCWHGAAVNCDDRIGCTEDVCIEPTGACMHIPYDRRCDDGLYCNGSEACVIGYGCAPGAPVDCSDPFPCTADSCAEPTPPATVASCVHTPDDTVCDDLLYCTGQERCTTEAGCVPGTAVVCDDSVSCSSDACDEDANGCAYVADDGACDDIVACTADTCELGIESPGCRNAPDDSLCNDGITCTLDYCDAMSGCVNAPNETLCPPPGICQDVTCDPVAEPVSGCLYTSSPDGTACDLVPAVDEVCVAGECVARGCGDGLLEGTEECDPGLHLLGVSCAADCTSEDFVVSDPLEGTPDDGREELGPADHTLATLDAPGRYVVAWTQDEDVDPYFADVRARVVDIVAGVVSVDINVTSTAMPQEQPVVVALPGGDFVVAWQGYCGAPCGDSGVEDVDIYLARYHVALGTGAVIGDTPPTPVLDVSRLWSRRINSTVGQAQLHPSMAVSPVDRTIVAVWEDWSAGSEGPDPWGLSGIRYRMFAPDGTPQPGWSTSGDALANSTTADAQVEPAVAVLPTGEFLIVWSDGSQTGDDTDGSAVRARLFASDGLPVGGDDAPDFVVNVGRTTWEQYEPSVAAVEVPGGSGEVGYVVAWTSMEAVSGRLTVRANFVSDAGVDPTVERVVPRSVTVSGGRPYEPSQQAPTVAADSVGNVVIAWVHEGPGNPPVSDPSSSAVAGIRLMVGCPGTAPCSLSTTATADTVLATTTTDTQETPSAALAAGGALALAWTDWSDADGTGGLNEIRTRYLPHGWLLGSVAE